MPTNCTQRLADACNCLLLVAHFMRGLLGFWGDGGHLYGAANIVTVKTKLAGGF